MAKSPFITENETISSKGIRNFTDVGSNPANKIDIQTTKRTISPTIYPPDLGKYRFVILESEINLTYNLETQKAYIVPLPYGMTEGHTANYDTNYNMVDALANISKSIASGFSPVLGKERSDRIGQAIGAAGGQFISLTGAATGLAVNQMKWVTLKSPSFNRHKFAWKFSPKTYEESKLVREIIYGLKTGMQVNKIGSGGSGQLFGFPKIYSMFYMPNMQFLYKFKPCVLEHIEIDYQGNNPAPAFFKDQTSSESNSGEINMDATLSPNAAGNLQNQLTGNKSIGTNVKGSIAYSPPESIVIQTTWLELEVWTQQDFRNKMQTNDPFDGYSFYGSQ